MIEYDPIIIQKNADRLYSQAKSVVMLYFFMGLCLGIIASTIISFEMTRSLDFLINALGVLIGGVLGYGAGRNRSFELKLAAQLALCQLKLVQQCGKG